MLDVMPLANEQLFNDLKPLLSPEAVLKQNEPLAKRTTLRVGGPADLYAEPASEKDLSILLQECRERGVKVMALGRGSNLLIRDGGVRGMVVSLLHPEFSKIEIHDNRVHSGAGAKLKNLAVEARRNGLAGFEFLEGIPGSVGGALRMNAGAMGAATFDLVESIRFMDFGGHVNELNAGEVYVKYRSCPLLKENIALSAVFAGRPMSPEAIAEKMKGFSSKRWTSQPAAPSAGCIFKNPLTVPAGKLIEELGLKRTRVGGAAVSDVHGNFIVNEGSATAKDVLQLIEIVRRYAKESRGIELETEVEIVGED